MTAGSYSIKFQDLEDRDISIEIGYRQQFKNELKHFTKTSELYISLFAYTQRTYRQKGKRDYIHLVAIRILQDLRSALNLGLRGLYPQASTLVRGALESSFLIYDFKLHSTHEDIWYEGGKNKRKKLFKAGNVRARIKQNVKLKPAFKIYELLSQWSLHANKESFLWYIEVKNKILYYHWAGQEKDLPANYIVYSSIFALAHALLMLVQDDIYTFTSREWIIEFRKWEKENLDYLKKAALIFGKSGYEKLQIQPLKIIPVVKP